MAYKKSQLFSAEEFDTTLYSTNSQVFPSFISFAMVDPFTHLKREMLICLFTFSGREPETMIFSGNMLIIWIYYRKKNHDMKNMI